MLKLHAPSACPAPVHRASPPALPHLPCRAPRRLPRRSRGRRTRLAGTCHRERGVNQTSILAYFLTVGSDAPTALAIEAIDSPLLALLRISSILSTPIIPPWSSSRRKPRQRHCWADCGWSACPCSKPKVFRAQARNFPALNPATSRLSNTLARRIVKGTMNGLLEVEADEPVGAVHYERNAGREACRVSHYDRGPTTSPGEVTIRIPKLKGERSRASLLYHHAGCRQGGYPACVQPIEL